MAYENIRFAKAHFAIDNEGYFYYIDEVTNILYKKVSNGLIASTFPLNTIIGSVVKALVYDGVFFWTLQDGSTNEDIVIKKWRIENYICCLNVVYEFIHNSSHKFRADTFAVEYYATTLKESVNGPYKAYCGDTSIVLEDGLDYIEPGVVLTIGPNNDGLYDSVVVTKVIDANTVEIDFFTNYNYIVGTPVYFSKNLWIMNKFAFSSLVGGLYQIYLANKEIKNVFIDADYKDIIAMCFYKTDLSSYLVMTLNTVLRFFDLTTYTVVKSMVVDNLKDDMSTVIPIHAIQVSEDTLFRLQRSATYYDKTFIFTSYNYQNSPLRSFIDSITIMATPRILPCNGVNISTITAIVKDQYSFAKYNATVDYQDSDNVGYITTRYVSTDLQGKALTYYRAGIAPCNVVVMALATQYN